MTWTIEPVALSDLKRRKQQPNYPFVEQSITAGAAYTIGGYGTAGYFIVASELSLVPGFVVELALPALAVPDEYESLAKEMSTRSLGVLWFDSSDRDACDFAWRLDLPLKSGAPLFAWNGGKIIPLPPGWEVGAAQERDKADVMRLLTTPPLDAGGQTPEAVLENFQGGCIAVLRRDGDVAGAAVLLPLPGPYVGLSSVVLETYSMQPPDAHQRAAQSLELAFMSALGSRASGNNLTMVYSMARQTPRGILEALELDMKIVRQGFMANFGTSWR